MKLLTPPAGPVLLSTLWIVLMFNYIYWIRSRQSAAHGKTVAGV